MAKTNSCDCGCGCCHGLIAGLMVFIFGLVKYLGYGWEMAFMAIGILIALKALVMKGK